MEIFKQFTNSHSFKYNDYLYPIIYFFKTTTLGSLFKRSEIIDNLLSMMQISDDEVTYTLSKSGSSLIKDRIGWAISYLTLGGYLERNDKKQYFLSEKGITVTKEFDLGNFHKHIRNKSRKLDHKASVKDEDIENNTLLMQQDDCVWKKIMLQDILRMSNIGFEKFCGDVLRNMNLQNVNHRGRTGDQGIDLEGYLLADNFLTYKVSIQCKKYALDNSVSSKEIQAFWGAMHANNDDRGVFITTSSFTKSAIEMSKKLGTKLTLINGDKLCDFIVSFNSGFVEEYKSYVFRSSVLKNYLD